MVRSLSSRVLPFCVLALCTIAVAGNKKPANADRNWSALAQNDLTYIYQMALHNHPGAIDEQNPGFRNYLDSGLVAAMAKAERAEDLSGYKTAISYYMAGFADSHFSVGFSERHRSLLWPGFRITRMGGRYVVDAHLDGEWPVERPPEGASLVQCDGRPAEQLLEEDVLFYRFRNYQLEARKFRYAHLLLAIDDIGEREPYQRCQFRHEGKSETYPLQWQSIFWPHFSSLTRNPNREMPPRPKLERLSEAVYWVYLPSFGLYQDAEIEAMEQVMEGLEALPDDVTVVFDVRFNGGGRSRWGVELLNALYGERYITRLYLASDGDKHRSEWRVSNGNLQYLENAATDPWRPAQQREEYQRLFEEMNAADQQGESWCTLDRGPSVFSRLSSLWYRFASPRSNAKTVLLTGPRCASACLDFADFAFLVPGSVQMGQETSADTLYLDIRLPRVQLPSGLGELALPMKVWRKRYRDHNESYVPAFQYQYKGDIYDTKKVQQWVLDHL